MTTQRTKLTLTHPVEMPDGSIVRALMVRAPTPDDAHEVRMACYAMFADVDRAIIDELDAADIRRLDALLDTLAGGPCPSQP